MLRHDIDDVKAVDDVSFTVEAGTTVGLVGESGSGKTTVGRTILKLVPATSGDIVFDGRHILPMSESQFRPLRREIQMIFQDPFGSLNPRMTIFNIVGEALEIHFPAMNLNERRDRVADLLKQVGLVPEMMNRYPHEFSGGQRQRIGIARALAVKPKFIVCDEPVSALDVSVQAQIVNLLQDLQQELGLTYLFIAHDLAVVEHVSDHVLVMYHGQIVESASAEEIYQNPRHDYTKKLLAAVPKFA
ncbi:MAG TPA: ATP-binding cassette domain-containing protein [Chthoniobacteraceae bacterium]|nr:ATP-binding cassette domain-containing protein [Chthoniobacteraceae bacterium]